MSSDEEFEEALHYLTLAMCLEEYLDSKTEKEPVHNSILQGNAWLTEVLKANSPVRCRGLFRMNKHTFYRLANAMSDRGLLQPTRHITVEEQLGMFLLTLGHNQRNFMIQDRFQHSGETVSRHFHNVLNAFVQFSKEIIVPPSFDHTPPEIRQNLKYMPWFKDCIGAIDGTHISACVSVDRQAAYRSARTGMITQNVMAVCSFDMQFTWIIAGWEGTAHDSRVMLEAINNPTLHFPRAPPGKYYVVDAGYPNMTGFLAPYRGVRYHLQDYRRGGGRARGSKEIFNHLHSSLRNIIERCFGVLKERFPILKTMPSYTFQTQVKIVIAACTIHNFIRQQARQDWLFEQYEDEDLIVVDNDDEHEDDINSDSLVPPGLTNEMAAFRDVLANAMEQATRN